MLLPKAVRVDGMAALSVNELRISATVGMELQKLLSTRRPEVGATRGPPSCTYHQALSLQYTC